MPIAITKDSIDLGLITKDAAALVTFYRDTLGLEQEGEMPMPGRANDAPKMRHIDFKNCR